LRNLTIRAGEPAPQVIEAGEDAPETVGRPPFWEVLRARLKDRPDTEHEQILVRVTIGVVIVLGLVIAALGYHPPVRIGSLLAIATSYLGAALLLLVHILVDPARRPARRYIGMSVDMLALTLVLLVGQGSAAVFYPFYLWITLGMGFRYGRRYLIVSAAISLLSFALVIALNEYWRAQRGLAAGLWLALLLLPLYASTLLTKLTDALTRAEEANRAKSRFVATMSHELRTPLHAIIGMADLLRLSPLRREQQDMVRTVRTAGQTLLEMIGDLLDIAKIESGTMVVQPAPFDLHAVLATVRSLLYHQARNKGLDLRLVIDPAVPYRLHGAARSLQQILVNLVTNAVKFTDTGSVAIVLSAEAIEPDEVTVRIEVQDSGIGIPFNAQEHIFERFAQADESATRRHGGTGLGLAIARQLASLMGGFLLVNSTPGVGSCFTFRGPFGRASAPEQRLVGRVVVVGAPERTRPNAERIAAFGAEVASISHLAQAPELLARAGPVPPLLLIEPEHFQAELAAICAGSATFDPEPLNVVVVSSHRDADWTGCLAILGPEATDQHLHAALHAAMARPQTFESLSLPSQRDRRWRPLRVLVAEDNQINQQVIERMLSTAGHAVTMVENGEQALDALETDGFDVALMDVNMPVMNGLDAIKLHRFATDGQSSPAFVALTADATDETRRQCEDAGVAAFLTKPVDMDELLALIDRVAGRRPVLASGLRSKRRSNNGAMATAPVLDLAHLSRLRELDDHDDFLGSLFRDFIADAEQLVDALQTAALDRDAATFRDRAHALRSSAGHIGATAMFELCHQWRDVGPDDLAAEGAVYATLLKAEFERLRLALLTELAGSEPHGPASTSPPH
jgi:two-component system sensor histidine kinase RpfC